MGGDSGLEAVVLPRGAAVGSVAVRGGEAEEGGAGDVCAPEGAGERVGHGEGEGVGVWAGAVWGRAVDGDRDGYGYGACFSASYASEGGMSLTIDDVVLCAEHVPGELPCWMLTWVIADRSMTSTERPAAPVWPCPENTVSIRRA